MLSVHSLKVSSFKKIVVSLSGQLFEQIVSNSCFLVAVSYRDRARFVGTFVFFFFLSFFLSFYKIPSVGEKLERLNSLGFVPTVLVRLRTIKNCGTILFFYGRTRTNRKERG